MNATRDLERRLADYYASEAPMRAPDRVLESALATIASTPQRRALVRLPWRFQNMNKFAGMAAAAVAVLGVGALALAALLGGRPPSVGTDPTPTLVPASAHPTPSGPAATADGPSPSAFPALTETFTSTIHGARVSYPAGWTGVPATLPWDGSEFPLQGSGTADVIYLRQDNSPFIAIASAPAGGEGGDAWVAESVAVFTDACDMTTEPVTIDGRAGVLVGPCETDGRPMLAVTSVPLALGADRNYLIYLYRIDDVEWFKEILSTVRLEPGNAVDPVNGSAFRHPFTVWMPPGVGWDALPILNEAYAEFRIPGSASDGNSSATGVILRAIDGGRRDPCAETSESMALEGGPETVVDYLGLIRGVRISSERETTVDGVPAIQALVQFDPTSSFACADPRPFARQDGVEETELFSQVPPGVEVRVTAFDIDGQHVVIWTWAETPDWYDVADDLIGAIDFQPAD